MKSRTCQALIYPLHGHRDLPNGDRVYRNANGVETWKRSKSGAITLLDPIQRFRFNPLRDWVKASLPLGHPLLDEKNQRELIDMIQHYDAEVYRHEERKLCNSLSKKL